jgi:hypothetical protein
MLPMKQAIDKQASGTEPVLGREGEPFPLSLAAANTQVQSNRFQADMEEKKERTSVRDI